MGIVSCRLTYESYKKEMIQEAKVVSSELNGFGVDLNYSSLLDFYNNDLNSLNINSHTLFKSNNYLLIDLK